MCRSGWPAQRGVPEERKRTEEGRAWWRTKTLEASLSVDRTLAAGAAKNQIQKDRLDAGSVREPEAIARSAASQVQGAREPDTAAGFAGFWIHQVLQWGPLVMDV
jgi:hypothetical protein